MIEFLTLFLGITGGPQTIALAADPNVAAVELRLDGRVVGRDEEPPWELGIDLGVALEPHALEAVAFDAGGREVGRTEQHLNVPRPPAEVHLLLEKGDDGRPRTARATWESAVRARPREFTASLDGEPLAVDDPEAIPLPALDPRQVHVLQLELRFSHDVAAQAQLVFGGAFLDTTSAELTAFPVAWDKGRATPGEMDGWFQKGGGPLAVVAVEKGLSDLILVRGPGVEAVVKDLKGIPKSDLKPGGGATRIGYNNAPVATPKERLRWALKLPGDQRLRLLLPRSRSSRGRQVELESFAVSPDVTADMGGLFWALSERLELPGLADDVKVWDAVAVAALQAANGNRRRAVLLVLSEDWDDESRYPAEHVVHFLRSLNVPLVVWQVGEEALTLPESVSAERVVNFGDLKAASRRLDKALDDQRIVWLEGIHLPNAVEVSSRAPVAPVTGGLRDR